MRVRAGNIQFIRRDPLGFIQDVDRLDIILAGVAKDVCDHDDIFLLRQLGQFFVNESARSNVLQSN